tara:strand:- start:5118 stop:6068 length:951 start_codon:yes stop_codon:yes gene_type:complete
MEKKKLKDSNLLDIPDFLKRLDDGRSTALPETVDQPAELEPVKQAPVEAESQQESVEIKPKRPSIQDRMRVRMFKIIGDLDDEFEKVWARNEDPKKFKAYNYFLANDIPGAFMKLIQEQVNMYIDEQSKGLMYRDIKPNERTDDQQDYVEGFESYSKKEMKQHITWWQNVHKDCETWATNKKKQRKPRKWKPPSKEKMAAKIKYKAEFPDLKLVSEPPIKLIGCSAVVIYNTKNRKLGIYEATHKHHGLTLKGTTLLNYDLSTALQKTVRKPQEVMEKLNTSGLQAIKNTFKALSTTETKLNGRLNKETVLVRIFQ